MPIITRSGLITSTSQIGKVIENADVADAAAIDYSKLAALNSARLLVGNGSNVAVGVDVTGDVTISNAGVTAVGAGKVTEAMQVLADNTTNDFSTSAHGYVPKGTNVGDFLKDDGTWASAGGGNSGFLAAAQGSTTGTTSQLLTKSISAAALGANDYLIIEITGQASTGAADVEIEVDDGTNTFASSVLGGPGVAGGWAKFIVHQGNDANTHLICQAFSASATGLAAINGEATMIASWIVAAMTVNVNMDAATSRTIDWKSIIYKRSAS